MLNVAKSKHLSAKTNSFITTYKQIMYAKYDYHLGQSYHLSHSSPLIIKTLQALKIGAAIVFL